MPTYKSYFSLTTATKSLNTSSSYIGGCVGAMFAGAVTDWAGRRRAIWLSSAITVVGAGIQTGATGIGMFIAGRIIVGVGMAAAAVSTPTYVVEVSKPTYRGFALGLYYSAWGIGTLIASGICYGVSGQAVRKHDTYTYDILNSSQTNDWNSTWAWRLPSLLQLVPSAAATILIFFVPESPRWLVGRDRHEEALEVLAVVNSQGNQEDPRTLLQFREISDTIHWEKTDGGQLSLLRAWVIPANRKRLTLAGSFSIVVMLCGNSTIDYYFGVMMKRAGITDSTTQLEINIIMTAWKLVVSVAASWYADRLSRKFLIGISVGLLAIFMYILGSMTAKYGETHDRSGIYGTIAMIFLCVGAYAIGINPLTVLYPAEVLSYRIRASGMALYTLTTKISGLIATLAFPFSLENIGWKTYMIFGSLNVLYLVLIEIFWVETCGLTLEEVDRQFDSVKHSDVPDLRDLDIAEDVEDVIKGIDPVYVTVGPEKVTQD